MSWIQRGFAETRGSQYSESPVVPLGSQQDGLIVIDITHEMSRC